MKQKSSQETKSCKLRYGLRFYGSKKTTYLCKDRHGFRIKHWKCVGFGEIGCPLTDKKSGVEE